MDHIFPEFLGGSQRVLIGEKCNKYFGHSFEAKIYNNFKPLMIALRFNKVPAPKYLLWRNAITHDGIRYNIDSNLKCIPYKPLVLKNNDGRISEAFGSKEFVTGIMNHFEETGREYKIEDKSITGIKPDLTFNLPLDQNTRRLALKMCIGLSKYMQPDLNIFTNELINFLNDSNNSNYSIFLDLRTHNDIERIRLPLSHVIMIEGNREKGVCYGIVQFYGMIQFYVPISEKYLGNTFSYIGILDSISFDESFQKSVSLFHIPPPPKTMNFSCAQELQQLILSKFNTEFRKRFGESSPNFI